MKEIKSLAEDFFGLHMNVTQKKEFVNNALCLRF